MILVYLMRYRDTVPITSDINTIINLLPAKWQIDTNVSLHAEPFWIFLKHYMPVNLALQAFEHKIYWDLRSWALEVEFHPSYPANAHKRGVFSHSHLLFTCECVTYIQKQAMTMWSHLLSTLHKISPAWNLIIEIKRRWTQIQMLEIFAKKEKDYKM